MQTLITDTKDERSSRDIEILVQRKSVTYSFISNAVERKA